VLLNYYLYFVKIVKEYHFFFIILIEMALIIPQETTLTLALRYVYHIGIKIKGNLSKKI
jgi:hypothetical protein